MAVIVVEVVVVFTLMVDIMQDQVLTIMAAILVVVVFVMDFLSKNNKNKFKFKQN
jgi:hypothetical protein